MMDAIINSLRGVWGLIESAPHGVWQVLAGLFGALVATHAIKPWLRHASHDGRRATLQAVALAFGFTFTWLPWQTANGAIAGILVGLGAPLLWATVTWLVRKRWPDFMQRDGGVGGGRGGVGGGRQDGRTDEAGP